MENSFLVVTSPDLWILKCFSSREEAEKWREELGNIYYFEIGEEVYRVEKRDISVFSSYEYNRLTTTIQLVVNFLPEELRQLEKLAERWGVTKTQAVRNAVAVCSVPAAGDKDIISPSGTKRTIRPAGTVFL